jgi:hypothetical protein
MRRVGLFRCSAFKVLGWGYSANGSVWSVMVVEVLEAVEDRVERFNGSRQVVDGVEFVSPSAVASFDRAVHLWRLGREDEEPEALFSQASSNSAMNSDPPSAPRPELRTPAAQAVFAAIALFLQKKMLKLSKLVQPMPAGAPGYRVPAGELSCARTST